MPSLRQILADHAPLLLIDAASSRIQVGLLDADGRARWAESEEEPGVGIFTCLESLGAGPAAVPAFAFAESPGSILGIRTSAMALRVWMGIEPRPVFAYNGLEVVALAAGRPELTFIADARRDAWHCCRLGGRVGRAQTAELSGPLATPEGFRNWTALPAGVERIPYRLSEMLPRVANADLFRATEEPDAALSAEPRYAAWTPRIHRKP